MAMNFVVCLQKDDLGDLSGDDIHVGRLYEVVEMHAGHGMVRVIDESGEDYLYPENCFEPVLLSESVAQRLSQVLSHH
ncbi:hypothetical protein [Thiocystis minor]|uniref:hypothetical protein n=1 Tax=Thiocystis minor TaxID=61597 RepID=UPI001A918823|nr:hypothetical protein [Thiocystis minor]